LPPVGPPASIQKCGHPRETRGLRKPPKNEIMRGSPARPACHGAAAGKSARGRHCARPSPLPAPPPPPKFLPRPKPPCRPRRRPGRVRACARGRGWQSAGARLAGQPLSVYCFPLAPHAPSPIAADMPCTRVCTHLVCTPDEAKAPAVRVSYTDPQMAASGGAHWEPSCGVGQGPGVDLPGPC
jgi:hypothetical protein